MPGRSAGQWADRRVLSGVLRLALFAGPLVVAVAAVQGAHLVLSRMVDWPLIADLGVLVVVAVVAGRLGERLTRRLMPLPGLLRMTLVFPDRAPSRLRVAHLSASSRQLDQLLQDDSAGERSAGEQILVLISALTRHDRRTRGHSERVRMYVDLLAAELGLPIEDRDRLRWAALLHDIGKLRIPVSLLNKPAALRPSEWDVPSAPAGRRRARRAADAVAR